jgi:hypothetical protein
MVLRIKGYVTDVPYVRAFVHQCAPAWLDHVAVVSGVVPPAREDGFAWCDLGSHGSRLKTEVRGGFAGGRA